MFLIKVSQITFFRISKQSIHSRFFKLKPNTSMNISHETTAMSKIFNTYETEYREQSNNLFHRDNDGAQIHHFSYSETLIRKQRNFKMAEFDSLFECNVSYLKHDAIYPCREIVV